MKRIARTRKLTLDKATIRVLSSELVRQVAGGQTLATCSAICSDEICPPTGVVHGCGPV